MRAYLFALGAIFLTVTGFGADTNGPAIVPEPQKMEVKEGRFLLGSGARIQVDELSGATGEYLAGKLRASTGFPVQVYTNVVRAKGRIELTTKWANPALGAEGYELDVTPDAVIIKAPSQAGLFYGVQTLMQLLPPQIFSRTSVTNVAWEIPFAVHIEDQPRFQWRGFMLDCARHFFSKEDVKRVLDEMALHKLNTFHWHLTDDQGWRIEIKKYPKLTEVGAWRAQSSVTPPENDDGERDTQNDHPAWSVTPKSAYGPDGRYGGFYLQDDVREVVAYAASLHITVVPEIEMPGHAIAALAAYPEYTCDGGPQSTDVKAGVNRGVFCVGDEKVYTFLDDILSEVMQLFPGKYIHVGGDEVDMAAKKANWGKSDACMAIMKSQGYTNLDQLQGYFTGRIGKFVNEHGKVLLGWSEIADAPLPQNAAVMDWIGGAVKAATNGHDVAMCPTSFCYLDYYQSLDHGTEPYAIGNFLPLERVYSFEPMPKGLDAKYQSHILGGQCNLWTEYIPSLANVEYMAFPRLCALAEVTWSPKDKHNWDDFSRRLQTHELRLEAFGVNYRRDLSVPVGEWKSSTSQNSTNVQWDVTSQIKGAGQYRIVFHFAKGNGLPVKSVALLEDGKEVVTDSHAGFAARNPSKPVYVLDLPAVKENAKYAVQASIGNVNSSGTVTLVFKPKAP